MKNSKNYLVLTFAVIAVACSKGGSSSQPVPPAVAPAATLGEYTLYSSMAEGDIYARNANRDGVLLLNRLSLNLDLSASAGGDLDSGSDLAERCQNTRARFDQASQVDPRAAHREFAAIFHASAGDIQAQTDLKEIFRQIRAEQRRNRWSIGVRIPQFNIEVQHYPQKSLIRQFGDGPNGLVLWQQKIESLIAGASVRMSAAELCDLINPQTKVVGIFEEPFGRSFPIMLLGAADDPNAPR